jgi:hypothetical protein
MYNISTPEFLWLCKRGGIETCPRAIAEAVLWESQEAQRAGGTHYNHSVLMTSIRKTLRKTWEDGNREYVQGVTLWRSGLDSAAQNSGGRKSFQVLKFGISF